MAGREYAIGRIGLILVPVTLKRATGVDVANPNIADPSFRNIEATITNITEELEQRQQVAMLAESDDVEDAENENLRKLVDSPLHLAPLEIWNLVFSRMGHIEDLYHCTQVNSSWKRFIHQDYSGQGILEAAPQHLFKFLNTRDILRCREVCQRWKRAVDNKLETDMSSRVVGERSQRRWIGRGALTDVTLIKKIFHVPIFSQNNTLRGLPTCLSPVFSRWVGIQVNFYEMLEAAERLVRHPIGNNIWFFELTANVRAAWQMEAFVVRLITYLILLPNLRSLAIDVDGPVYYIEGADDDIGQANLHLPGLPYLEDLKLSSSLQPDLCANILQTYGPQLKSLAFDHDFQLVHHAFLSQSSDRFQVWPLRRLDLSKVLVELPLNSGVHPPRPRLQDLLVFLGNFRQTLKELEVYFGGFFDTPQIPHLNSTILGWDAEKLPQLESLIVTNSLLKSIDFILAWRDSLKSLELRLCNVEKNGKIRIVEGIFNEVIKDMHTSNIWKKMPRLETVTRTELMHIGDYYSSARYRRPINEEMNLKQDGSERRRFWKKWKLPNALTRWWK